MRVFKLRDMTGVPSPVSERFSPETIAQARESLERANLRFDNSTGKIYLGRECGESYCTSTDHVPHKSAEEVMRWEFSRWIKNSASRISRGFKAV